MCDTKISSYSNIQSTLNQSQSSSANEPSMPNKGLLDGKSIKQVDAPKIVQNQELLPTQNSNLQNSQVIQKNPPVGLSELVRYEALPDRQRMIERCGRPKDDLLFGLIKMSTNYKSVLDHLDKVKDALAKSEIGAKIPDQIGKFKNELKGLEKAVDHYIAGSDNQRFKTEMKSLKQDIIQEQNTLKVLESNAKNWPIGVTLKEAMDYSKQGISAEHFKIFKECIIHPEFKKPVVNYLENNKDDLYMAEDTNPSSRISRVKDALENLNKAMDQYSNKEQFKDKVQSFKNDIVEEKKVLDKLNSQANDWPKDMSLKEAFGYTKEGFSLAEAKFLKEHFINPQDVHKLISNEMISNEDKMVKSIIDKLDPDKVTESVCNDAQKLRADLRKNDGLSEENVAKLLSQADYAVKQYVDIFKNTKIPADFSKMNHAQLENNINQLPQADLSEEDREIATKLMDLINENTSLIHLKYQGFDQRFTMSGDTDTLEKVNIAQQLEDLIPSEKIKNSKEIESIVKNHLNGLLRDRIDARIAFGAMDSKQITHVLEQWLSKITSLTPQQRSDLSNDILPKLINQYLPKIKNTKDVNEIGDGASAIVFNALLKEEIESDENKITKETPVVVKMMKQSPCENISPLGSISESLRQAGLNENPYVPKIVGFSKDRLAIFMEKTDGGNYKKLLNKFKTENDGNIGIRSELLNNVL